MSIFSKFFGLTGKQSQLKGIKKKKSSGLHLETLEDRQLLSVSPTGFGLHDDVSQINAADATSELTFTTLDVPSAVYGFVVAPNEGSEFDPGQIAIYDNNADPNHENPLAVLASNTNYNGMSLVLAQLNGNGEYAIVVSGENETTGSFTCEVFLPGDLNGDNVVTTGEAKLVLGGYKTQSEYLEPHITPGQQEAQYVYPQLYGASYEYIVANMGKFDLNFDGVVNQFDYDNIASVNQTASNNLATGNNFQNQTDLVADQDSPVITPPANKDTVVEEETGDPADPTINVYTTAPEDAIVTAQDPTSSIESVSVTIGEKTYNLDPGEMTVDPETGEVSVSLDNIFDAMERIDGTRPGEGTYPITITFTDEYDHSSSLDLTFNYEEAETTAKDPVLNPQADQEGYDDAGAEKEGYPVVSVSSKTSLQEFVSGTEATALIYLSDGSQARFKEVTDGTVQYWDYTLDTPAWVTATGVTYTLSETGDIQIVYAEGTDPFAWLSTFESDVHDQATNKVVLQVAFDVANIYFKNSEDANHWKAGTLQVELKPENDLPTAVADAANVTEIATKATSQEVAVLNNDSDPDKWDEFTAIGIQFNGTNYFFKDAATIEDAEYGVYNGCKYVEITPDGATQAIRVLQYNSADTTNLHEQANKLVIDLQGAYNWLAEGEIKDFTFSYIMTDAANKGMTEIDMAKCSVAVVTMTVNGVNNPPVVEDATFDDVNENQTTGKVTPVVTDPDTTDTYTIAVDDATVTDWNDRAVKIVAESTDSPEKTAIIQAAANALNDVDLLACVEAVNSELAEGEKPYFKFNPLKENASLFSFLGVGETLTLTFKYYATDSSVESERADLTVTITGVNNTPVVTGWTVDEIEGDVINSSTISLQKADPNTDPATPGWSDADLNDTQIFYQFQTYEKNEENTWVSTWKELTVAEQNVYDSEGYLTGTVKYGVTDSATDMTKVLYTPSANIKWDTSDITKPTSSADLSFTIKDSSGVVEGEYTGISDPFTVTVPIKGVYNAPELFDARNMTISVSKTDQLTAKKTTDEGQEVVGSVDATVDAGYTGEWAITKATIADPADTNKTIDVSSYFQIKTTTDTDAKTGLTVTYGTISWAGADEAAQQANQKLFHETYMDAGDGMNSLPITFAATLTDTYDPANTVETGNLTLTATKKTPPIIEYKVDTEQIGGVTVALSGQTANENDDDPKTFDLDDFYTIKDGETKEKTTAYEYVSLTLDVAKSTVKNGETSTDLSAIFGTDGPFEDGEFSVTADGDFSMALKRATEQIFDKLAVKGLVHDSAQLVFSVKVHDTEADATCTTTVYFAVNVTGENDAPTVTGTENLGGFNDVGPSSVIDVNLVDTYANDIDWSDVLSISDKALADTSTIDGVTKTAAEVAEYFGLTVEQLNDLLTFTEGTGPGAAGSGKFTYGYDEAFKKLPMKSLGEGVWVGVEAVLNYSMKVADLNGATADKVVSVTITGTNQAPSALVTRTQSVDLQSDSGNIEYDIVVGTDGETSITDIDTGDVLTPALTFVNIKMGGAETTDFGTACDAIKVNAETRMVEIDIAALNAQFAELAKGQTVDVCFTYGVTDAYGDSSDATNNTFTVTITGRNEQPTAAVTGNTNVTMSANSAAKDTKVTIDWSASSDLDTLPAANADTLKLYQIYGIAEDQIALNKTWIDVSDVDAADKTKTVYVFGEGDDAGKLQGKVVVSWDTVNEKQIMDFYPIADVMIGGATQSTVDTYQWKLDAADTLDYSFQFTVIDSNKIVTPEDQNQTSVSAPATVSGTVTGVFDNLVLTLPTSVINVPTQGKVDGGYLVLSGNYTWKCEDGHEGEGYYNFSIDNVTATDAEPGTLAAADFKVTVNADGTLTLMVKKEAAEANVDKSFEVSVKYENTTDSDTDSGTFKIKVIEKSAPVVKYKDNPEAFPTFVEQTTKTTNYDLTANVIVTDGDDLSEADSFTVNTAASALTFKGTGADSSYTKAELASIADAIRNCASIVKDGDSYKFQFVNTYVNEQSLFAFLTKDQKLELVFEYEIDSYTVGEQKFDIPANATITVTINGENNDPVGVDVTWGTVIAGSAASADMTIADLFIQNGAGIPGFAYDVDAANKELDTAFNLRTSNINQDTLIILGYANAGDTTATEITLTAAAAADATKVYLVSGAANSPYVTLELDGTTPKLVYHSNGYYGFLSNIVTESLAINYKVIDNEGIASANFEQLTLNIKGDYQVPSLTDTPIANQAVDVEDSVILNLETYFNFKDFVIGQDSEGNDVYNITWALNLPEEYSDIIKFYEFDNVAKTLTITLFDKADYIDDMDLSAIEMSITCTDSKNNTVESNDFTLSCNQEKTVQIAMIGTTDIPTNNPTSNNYPGSYDRTNRVYYVDRTTFDAYASTQKTVTVDSNNGYYVEIWLRDNMVDYFGIDTTGCKQCQFILEYDGNVVEKIYNPGVEFPEEGEISDYGLASLGWAINSTNDPLWFDNITSKTADGEKLDAVMGTIITGKGTFKGSDANGTGVLVCRLYVKLKAGNTDPALAGLELKGYDGDLYYVHNGVYRYDALNGFNYKRNLDSDAIKVNNGQVSCTYYTYNALPLRGTTQMEQVVDGGIYVRTVTEATEVEQVEKLSGNADYLNEWQTHYAELWVKLSDMNATTGAEVVLNYDSTLFTPANVEWSSLFKGEGIIDYEMGTITFNADASLGFVNGNGYALLGRVMFKAMDVQYENAAGEQVSTSVKGISIEDAQTPASLGWSLSRGVTHYLKTEDIESYLGLGSSTEVWAVAYDVNDDNYVTADDVLEIYNNLGKSYRTNSGYNMFYDFDGDGFMTASDVLAVYSYIGLSRSAVAEGRTLEFTEVFTQRYVGSTLETEDDVRMVGYVLDAANEAWREALGLEEAIDVQLIVGDYDGESELGKAVITAWDANGIPSAGTIYLDDDANGSTWLAQIEGSVDGSAKYDLYTVLLHELGHLYGYDAENDAFAAVVDQFDFIAEEGHSTVASDVMSSTLEPGQRKELTTNDVYALATAYATATENYTVPATLVQAWSAQNAVESPVAAALPEEGNDENVSDNKRDLINSDIKTTRSTLEQLNSLGLNVPSITVIEDKGEVVDQSVNDMFVQDDEDDEEDDDVFIPEESALPNDGYENLLDTVMNDYNL